jgi:hypothetical protein
MDTCPQCGADIEGTPETCPACGTSLEWSASLGERADTAADTSADEATATLQEAAAGDRPDDLTAETANPSGVSRRGVLFYSGGSAALTLAALGGGWFAFIREDYPPEEAVVREYVDALNRGHFYTAQNLFHENAPGEAWTAQEFPTAKQVSLDVQRTEVVDRQSDLDIPGVRELALVHVDIEYQGGSERRLLELAFIVAQNMDDEWRLWKDR